MFSKYKYVYAVYEEKSFTRAAQKLFISQPSLSAAIKGVEQKVGAPLFERGNGVKLTQVGEEYIKTARDIMGCENDFTNKINDIYNLDTGHITVGGTNYLSSYVLPDIINRFKALYPKIEVTLVEGNSTALSTMIKNEEIDIVIDSFEDPTDSYKAYPLISEKILLCVPASFEINKSISPYRINPNDISYSDNVKGVSVSLFKDENFVLLKSGNDMYERAMRIFNKNNINPSVSFSVDQLNISYALAASGMGICFVTDTLFKYGRFNDNVFLYNIDSDMGIRSLYVAHKKQKYCTRAMSEFIKAAQDVIG